MQCLFDIAWPVRNGYEFLFGYAFEQKKFDPTNEERQERALFYEWIDTNECARGVDCSVQEKVDSQTVSDEAARRICWDCLFSKPNIGAIIDPVILYVLPGSGYEEYIFVVHMLRCAILLLRSGEKWFRYFVCSSGISQSFPVIFFRQFLDWQWQSHADILSSFASQRA